MAKMEIMRRLTLKIKKIFFLMFLVAVTLLFFTSCGKDDAKVVFKIPNGFVNLREATENTNGVMQYGFFETLFAILDADGNSIYNTVLNNSDFIVKYKGDYYVNEEKYSEMVEIAAISPEQRRKTYSLSDEVKVRGAGETVYTVKITALEHVGTQPIYQNNLTTYEIKYTASSAIPENTDWIIRGMVETNTDTRYDIFDFVDTGEGTAVVNIEIRENEKIKAIVLISPDYPGLIYRIIIEE